VGATGTRPDVPPVAFAGKLLGELLPVSRVVHGNETAVEDQTAEIRRPGPSYFAFLRGRTTF
jgi:hypothetical protein